MPGFVAPPPLEVRGLSVRFGGLRALEAVSLAVSSRAVVGVVGPNGAGKTTLFDCVTGTVRASSGAVLLFGRDVTSWPPHRRAGLGLARTFQRPQLFGSLTVRQNLIVALESELRRGGVCADLLALPGSVETRADAEDLADGVLAEVGLRQVADVRAGDLPIGMARLVELARALALYPRILLLDEPSSGLSDAESAWLAALLRASRDERGRTVMLVEHDMAFVLGVSDRVAVLDFGRLIAWGTPAEVAADPRVRAAYLGEEVDGAVAPR